MAKAANSTVKGKAMTIQNAPSSNIRPDMPRDKREAPQHCSAEYLDTILLEAFTARTADEVRRATDNLADLQEQCLKHIRFLCEAERNYRATPHEYASEIDDGAYNEVASFLASVGASLAGVSHQLGFSLPRPELDPSLKPAELDNRSA